MPPYHLVTLRNTCIIFQQNWLWLWVTFLLHSFPILSSASIMLRSHSIHSLLFFACTALLLLLSRFSRVRLCVTPQTAAHQAPPSLGFSRQEHWSGLPFLSPVHESEKWKWVAQSCLTLSNPMDCSLPGSSVLVISQARVLEWVAISFSRGSSWPRDLTQVSCIAGGLCTNWAIGETPIYIHVSLLFQIVFPFRLLPNIEQSSLCYNPLLWKTHLNFLRLSKKLLKIHWSNLYLLS